MTRALITTLAVLLSACASPQPVPESSHTTASDDAASGKEETPSSCVQTCTDERRTEAIDWAVIVAECEASCAERETR